MATVKVYGASDDLVEVEGDISEEFNFIPDDDEDSGYLAFDDGTMLSIAYVGGFWRINKLCEGIAQYAKLEGTDEDTDYSDVVTLTGAISAVVFGTSYTKAAKD